MSELYINIHVTVESIEKKAYTCTDCEIEFNSDQSLKKHLLDHYQIKDKNPKYVKYRFYCPIQTCRRSLKMEGEYFSSRKHLYQHYQKVHSIGIFQCTQKCDKKFATETLRNLHMKNCGKLFTCHCNLNFNSKEALQTHQKRKHPNYVVKKKVVRKEQTETSMTKEVSTTTSGLGLWNSTENLATRSDDVKTISVFTSTDHPISSYTKSAATSPIRSLRNSATSMDEPEVTKEESSNSSGSIRNKKNPSWMSQDFDDTINLFDSDSKMEFYSTETQTDFTENIFHNNNYTQTTFSDFYDFEKFDSQTQTNWNEL